MIELVRRDFVVDVAPGEAWNHLTRVEDWPSWAHHIKAVRLVPTGPLTASSEGTFRLAGGARSTFRMEVFDPPRRWQWVGRFLTVHVHYDHRFEAVDPEHTRLTWTVEAEGPGARTLGRIFAAVYDRNLARAIPRLQLEMRSTPGTDS